MLDFRCQNYILHGEGNSRTRGARVVYDRERGRYGIFSNGTDGMLFSGNGEVSDAESMLSARTFELLLALLDRYPSRATNDVFRAATGSLHHITFREPEYVINICTSCRASIEKKLDESRKETWDLLPDFFDLRDDWHVLRQTLS